MLDMLRRNDQPFARKIYLETLGLIVLPDNYADFSTGFPRPLSWVAIGRTWASKRHDIGKTGLFPVRTSIGEARFTLALLGLRFKM